MNDRLKDLRDKNYRIAQEQQFIALQPAWLAAEQPSVPLLPPPVADSADGRLITASSSSSSTSNSLAPPLSVERDVALMSPYIQKEVVQNGLGLPDAPPVPLPKQVWLSCGARAVCWLPWLGGWTEVVLVGNALDKWQQRAAVKQRGLLQVQVGDGLGV